MINLYPRDIGVAPALLSIDETRKQCRVDHEDEDAELLGYAASAQAWVEAFTGLRLTERPAMAQADCWGEWRIIAGPAAAISIGYVDAAGDDQTLAPADYVVRDQLGLSVVRLRAMVTRPQIEADSIISIGMTLGFAEGEAPADLRVACLLLAAHWYRNREAVVTGTIATEIPLAVESLCIRHRLAVAP